MASPFLIASLLAIIPAVMILWFALRRYTDFFDEKAVFFTLAVGLFVGIVVATFELTLFGFQFVELQSALNGWGSLIWVVFGYALFESGAKVVVLGLRRFRAHGDAPYYGVSLGIASGAMVSVQMIAYALRAGEATGNPYTIATTAAMVLAPIGAIATHGAAGIVIARGASQGRLGAGWAKGMVLQMPVLLALWFWWQDAGVGNALVLGPGILGLAYGLILLEVNRRRILEKVVPPEIRDEVRRQKRREARRGNRDAALPLVAHDSEE